MKHGNSQQLEQMSASRSILRFNTHKVLCLILEDHRGYRCLGLCTSTTRGTGLTPGHGTKSHRPHSVAPCFPKIKKKMTWLTKLNGSSAASFEQFGDNYSAELSIFLQFAFGKFHTYTISIHIGIGFQFVT